MTFLTSLLCEIKQKRQADSCSATEIFCAFYETWKFIANLQNPSTGPEAD